jgi:hypothetical protein
MIVRTLSMEPLHPLTRRGARGTWASTDMETSTMSLEHRASSMSEINICVYVSMMALNMSDFGTLRILWIHCKSCFESITAVLVRLSWGTR